MFYRIEKFLFNPKNSRGIKSLLGGVFAVAFFFISQELPFDVVTRFISIPILLLLSLILLMKILWHDIKAEKKTSFYDLGLLAFCLAVMSWGYTAL